MTRPIPISSKPRPVIITGHARFEWTPDGGCPEVTNSPEVPKGNRKWRSFQRVDSTTLPHIRENNVIALVQAVKQMEKESHIKRTPVSAFHRKCHMLTGSDEERKSSLRLVLRLLRYGTIVWKTKSMTLYWTIIAMEIHLTMVNEHALYSEKSIWSIFLLNLFLHQSINWKLFSTQVSNRAFGTRWKKNKTMPWISRRTRDSWASEEIGPPNFS